jgi:hypothetical protein
VGRKFADADLGGELLHDMPDKLFRYRFAPNLAGAAYTPKETTGIDSGRRRPSIHKPGHPIWNRDGSNVTGLPAEVHNCPMPFALLKMANGQYRQLVPPKPAGEQKCQKCPTTFTLHLPAIGCLPQSLPCPAVNQLPILTPSFLTPFTRRIPAAAARNNTNPRILRSRVAKRTMSCAGISIGTRRSRCGTASLAPMSLSVRGTIC